MRFKKQCLISTAEFAYTTWTDVDDTLQRIGDAKVCVFDVDRFRISWTFTSDHTGF